MVFIQFAGFTFGKSASAFATPWNGYPGNNNSYLMGGPDYVSGSAPDAAPTITGAPSVTGGPTASAARRRRFHRR